LRFWADLTNPNLTLLFPELESLLLASIFSHV
jgi:hypothetical protein